MDLIIFSGNVGKDAEYSIYRARSGKKFVRIAKVNGGKGSFTDKRLRTDKTYKYKIVSLRTEIVEVPDEDAEEISAENDVSEADAGDRNSDSITVKTYAYSKVKTIP